MSVNDSTHLLYGHNDEVQFNMEKIGNTVTLSGDVAIVNSVTQKMISVYCSGYSREQNELRAQLKGLIIQSYENDRQQGIKASVILKLVDSLCITVRNGVNRDPRTGRILTTRVLNIDLIRNELGGALSNEHILMMQKKTKLFGSKMILVSTNAHDSLARLSRKVTTTTTRAITSGGGGTGTGTGGGRYYRRREENDPEDPTAGILALCFILCFLLIFLPIAVVILCFAVPCLICLSILGNDD